MTSEDKAKLRPPLSFVVFVCVLATASLAATAYGIIGTFRPMWAGCGFLFAMILAPQAASELRHYHHYRPNP